MLKLEGSCHCGAVRFSVLSHTPIPYMHCYCSICRKTAGGGGSAINIMGEAGTLAVSGEEHLSVYQAVMDGEPSEARRSHLSARPSFSFNLDNRATESWAGSV